MKSLSTIAPLFVKAMALLAVLPYGQPAAASSSDVVALIHLTICDVTDGDPKVLTPHVYEMSIVGDYAEINFITGGGNSSGELFFHKDSGKWRKIGGGGYASASVLTTEYGIPETTAQALKADLKPPPSLPTSMVRPASCG